jgi:Protein of unknown function (DUF1282).
MWRNIFVTIVQLIVASPRAWKEINKENGSQNDFLHRFLHPIFGVIALTSFVGGLWFTRNGDVESALKNAIINVIAVYGGYYIASYTLNETALRFGLEKNLPRFQQFVGYSSVALYALYIIIPLLSDFFILWLLALYTVHLVHTGAPFFLKIREDKRMNFTIAASALIVLAPTLINLLFSFLIN